MSENLDEEEKGKKIEDESAIDIAYKETGLQETPEKPDVDHSKLHVWIADAGNDTTICDTIGSIVFNGNTPIIGTGNWIVSIGTGILTDATFENTDVFGLSMGTNELIWSISNGVCSASSDSLIIVVESCNIPIIELIVPTGFTPDNDMTNDTWEIIGIDQYPDCQVDIYNKWGNKIFSSKGYNEFWDGTFNGKPLPISTYYYVIVLNNGSTPLKGTITIIK